MKAITMAATEYSNPGFLPCGRQLNHCLQVRALEGKLLLRKGRLYVKSH